MGREAKIGLGLIAGLLIVLGFVLFDRLKGSPTDSSAVTTEGRAPSEAKRESSSTRRQREAPWAASSGPTIVTAQAGSNNSTKGASAPYFDDWTVTTDQDNAGQGKSGSRSDAPTTFMPKLVGASSDRDHAGDAGQHRVGSAVAGQSGYDPYAEQASQDGGREGDATSTQVAQSPVPLAPEPTTGRTGQAEPSSTYDPYRPASQDNRLRAQNDATAQSGEPRIYSRTTGGQPYSRSVSSPRGAGRYQPSTFGDSSYSTYRGSAGPSQIGGQYGISGSTYGSSGFSRQIDVDRSPTQNGTYVIRPNDNYWVISRKLYGTGAYFQALAQHNVEKCPEPEQLQVGQEIAVPSIAELEEKYRDLCPKPEHREAVQRRTSTVSTSSRLGGRVYVVQEGDTLYDIARWELGKASRWADILERNRDLLGDAHDYLTPGMQLVLPGDPPAGTVTQRPDAVYQR